jgi:dihydroorotate dehydrogenase
VQVGTANFINARATVDIIEGLKTFLVQQHIASVADIIGTLAV